MKIIKMRAAKRSRRPPPHSRRRCPVLAARPGNCVFVVTRQMGCSARIPRLDGRNAQNKHFMMRQAAKFCKLISPRAESERAGKMLDACDATRNVKSVREGKDDEGVGACACGSSVFQGVVALAPTISVRFATGFRS